MGLTRCCLFTSTHTYTFDSCSLSKFTYYYADLLLSCYRSLLQVFANLSLACRCLWCLSHMLARYLVYVCRRPGTNCMCDIICHVLVSPSRSCCSASSRICIQPVHHPQPTPSTSQHNTQTAGLPWPQSSCLSCRSSRQHCSRVHAGAR